MLRLAVSEEQQQRMLRGLPWKAPGTALPPACLLGWRLAWTGRWLWAQPLPSPALLRARAKPPPARHRGAAGAAAGDVATAAPPAQTPVACPQTAPAPAAASWQPSRARTTPHRQRWLPCPSRGQPRCQLPRRHQQRPCLHPQGSAAGERAGRGPPPRRLRCRWVSHPGCCQRRLPAPPPGVSPVVAPRHLQWLCQKLHQSKL